MSLWAEAQGSFLRGCEVGMTSLCQLADEALSWHAGSPRGCSGGRFPGAPATCAPLQAHVVCGFFPFEAAH